MHEQTDILIIGGGPAGLSCARELARQGRRVLILERKSHIGAKVCAGGITWSGLLQHVPAELIERPFPSQTIVTNMQRCQIREPMPMVATINRVRLGQWMATRALEAGARIQTNARVLSLANNQATVRMPTGQEDVVSFNHLVGADGANSLVRRHLNLTTEKKGIGLNACLPIVHNHMQWHFDPKRFRNGYAWIFPHRQSCSVGAYMQWGDMPVGQLKDHLIDWAQGEHIQIPRDAIQAGLINYDYQGHRFGNSWLIGEAAGLTSGLTGEGIYPAIVSGQEVARALMDPGYKTNRIEAMVSKQEKHNRVLQLSARHPLLCTLLVNLIVVSLRMRLISFNKLEMTQ